MIGVLLVLIFILGMAFGVLLIAANYQSRIRYFRGRIAEWDEAIKELEEERERLKSRKS